MQYKTRKQNDIHKKKLTSKRQVFFSIEETRSALVKIKHRFLIIINH